MSPRKIALAGALLLTNGVVFFACGQAYPPVPDEVYSGGTQGPPSSGSAGPGASACEALGGVCLAVADLASCAHPIESVGCGSSVGVVDGGGAAFDARARDAMKAPDALLGPDGSVLLFVELDGAPLPDASAEADGESAVFFCCAGSSGSGQAGDGGRAGDARREGATPFSVDGS